MRFFVLLLAFITAVVALPPRQKPVVISFPDNTPSSIIDRTISEIKKDGGIITHKYSLIKGFAARVSEVTLNKIAELTEAYAPYIEEDFVVKIDGSSGSPQ